MEDYDKIKKTLAVAFMNVLDNNRPEGKMCLSNGECADIEKAFNEQDWPKLARYLDKYTESEDERIRLALLTKFVGEKNQGAKYTIHGCSLDSIITYLEKQKQKPDIELIQQSWYMEGYQDRAYNFEPKWIINTGKNGPKYKSNPKYGQPLAEKQKPVTFNDPYNPDDYEVVTEGNSINLRRKEQKPAEINFEDWDTLGYIRDIVRKHVRRDEEFNVLDKWLTEHYVNQKSAWSEGDEKAKKWLIEYLIRLLNSVEKTSPFGIEVSNAISFIKSIYSQSQVKLKEEDKQMQQAVINCIDQLHECNDWQYVHVRNGNTTRNIPIGEVRKWVESLNLSKQEWREEDERIRNQLIYDVEQRKEKLLISAKQNKATKAIYDEIEKCQDEKTAWLKSLRTSWKPSELEKGALRTAIHILAEERNFPKAASQLQNILDAFEGKESRKDWKPSEEQMEALKWLAEYVSPSEEYIVIVKNLYEQLKKL